MALSTAAQSITCRLEPIAVSYDHMVDAVCPSCGGAFELHMPDGMRPDCLLAVCCACSTWHYIEVSPDGEEAVMVQLPFTSSGERGGGVAAPSGDSLRVA